MARRCQNCDKLWSKCSLALTNTRIPHSRNLYKWKYFDTFHHNQLFSSTNSLLIVLNLENLKKWISWQSLQSSPSLLLNHPSHEESEIWLAGTDKPIASPISTKPPADCQAKEMPTLVPWWNMSEPLTIVQKQNRSSKQSNDSEEPKCWKNSDIKKHQNLKSLFNLCLFWLYFDTLKSYCCFE